MKTYKIEVTRIDDFKIEIDETIWDAAALADWSKVFHQVDDIKEIAENIAQSVTHHGLYQFYEGYGYVRTYNEDGEQLSQGIFRDGKYIRIPEDEYAKGIKVIIINQEDYECDSSEVETEK